eukprot:3576279-Pleurochrysis_carterae.AAC.2
MLLRMVRLVLWTPASDLRSSVPRFHAHFLSRYRCPPGSHPFAHSPESHPFAHSHESHPFAHSHESHPFAHFLAHTLARSLTHCFSLSLTHSVSAAPSALSSLTHTRLRRWSSTCV